MNAHFDEKAAAFFLQSQIATDDDDNEKTKKLRLERPVSARRGRFGPMLAVLALFLVVLPSKFQANPEWVH